MQMNSHPSKNPLSLLEEKWQSGYGLHIDGLVFADGRVVLCDCVKLKRDGRSIPLASPIGDSTLDSILKYDDDPWVALTELDRSEIAESNVKISCGEGAMGNEGYVAVTALDTGRLIWMAFFTCSNPFEALKLVDGEILAENSYEQEWIFPLDHPERVRISPGP
jgi:hypothetical protein